jgi:hypothetical protein
MCPVSTSPVPPQLVHFDNSDLNAQASKLLRATAALRSLSASIAR